MNTLSAADRVGLSERKLTISLIILLGLSIFFLNENIRSAAVNEMFGYFNIPLFLVGCLMMKMIVQKSASFFALYVACSFSIVWLAYSKLFLHNSVSTMLQTAISVCIPLVLLSLRLDRADVLPAFKVFLYLYNGLIFVLLAVGAVDFATGGGVQLFLANTVFSGQEISSLIYIERLSGVYRYYSFLGHPLSNAKYFLLFFIFNYLYARQDRFLIHQYVVTVVLLLGLLLCASKTGLLIGLFLVVICSNIKKHKVLYYGVIAVVGFFLFQSTLFQENLMQRYVSGIEGGDITTGRNDLIELLVNSGGEMPRPLFGGGAGYSREVAKGLGGNIFNFEYPIIMLAYDYGITGTFILYFLLFIYPMLLFLKHRDYYCAALFLAISLMVNSNNGLANLGSDGLAQHAFVALFMIHMQWKNRPSAVNEYAKEGV